MARDVFISYKSEEYDDAMWLYNSLRKEGISVWMAPQDIPGGSSYAKEITHAIKGCKVFVLLLSNAAQASQWIPKEIDNAINENKLILPFMVEKCELNPEFSFYLSNIQFKEAYKDKEKAWKELLFDIKEFLGGFITDDPKEFKKENESYEAVSIPAVTEEVTEKSFVQSAPSPAKKAPAPPPAPSKREKKKNGAAKGKKNSKKLLGIIAAVFVVIIVAVCITVGLSGGKKTVIAGTEVKIDAYSVRLDGVSVEQQDIDVLGSLENLTSIIITNCTINANDLSILSREDLYTLNLSGSNISQIQLDTIDFTVFKKLNELNLSYNSGIDTMPRFSALTQSVTSLDISATSIDSIDFLKDCEKLRVLGVSHLGIKSLEALEKCIYLEKLSAAGNGILSSKGLENCTLLYEVDLSGNKLSDIAFLEKSATKLKKLNLSNNEISDLSALKKCTLINVLNVEKNKIEDLDVLYNMKELVTLDASDNKLTEFNNYSCKKLTFIDLSNNKISVIVDIELEDEAYVKLHLQNNEITSLQTHENCNYTELFIEGNPIKSLSKLKDLTRISYLTVDFNEEFDFSQIGGNTFKLTLYNCPLDKQVGIKQIIANTEFLEK